MRNSNKIFSLALLVFLLPAVSRADVLMMKDGQAITGKFQGADQTSVNFLVNGQSRHYSIYDINSITFTSPGAETSNPPTLQRRSEPAPLTPSPSADTARTRPRAPEPPRPLNVTVHAGSVVTVRMIDEVDSAIDQLGKTYRASLDEPLVVDGETVVPRGADVTAKLVSVDQSGRIKGRSELSLVLLDITVQGQRHEMTTSEVTQSGSSRGKQTATRAGVGAALGAAIGAIAGGGKGAAIGAGAGAGAGTAISLATHGEQVKVPPETRLDFTLAQPLNL